MEKPSSLFTGVFAAFLLSAGAMVIMPHNQMSGLQPTVGDWDGSTNSPTDVYPVQMEGGLGQRLGQRVFMEHGCFYCHSQQVRDRQYGPDMERGWGPRRTVARDYLYEEAPLLGSLRLGPDFANYGWVGPVYDDKGQPVNDPATGGPKQARNWRNEPADDTKKPAERNAAWIFRHLYNPKTIVSDSNCPPMRHLFEWVDTGAKPSEGAVAVEGNRQLVPNAEARNLADYLLSLNRTHELKEAPTMIKPKEAKK
jgi:cytochrome c oxidase cbb3-type subunit II